MTSATQMLYVKLGYSPWQAERILEYLESHRVENGGRYKLEGCVRDDGTDSDELAIFVYSHPWTSPGAKEESTIMCSIRYKSNWPGIGGIMPHPGFNWQTAWAELAVIEQAALDETIHGLSMAESGEMLGIRQLPSGGIPAEIDTLPRSNVSLRYSRSHFYRLLSYLKEHRFPFRGRYVLPAAVWEDPEVDLEVVEVNVHSCRPFGPNGPRPEPIRCKLRFHCGKQAIDYLEPVEGSGSEAAWAELAILEEAALRKTIYGKHPVNQEEKQP